MKVIKNINNNVSLCVDNFNRKVIVFGKGVGFIKPPNILALTQIEQTFYNIDITTIEMLSNMNEDVIAVTKKIVDYAWAKLPDKNFSSNLLLTLSDHINFAIDRHKKNMDIKLPINYDIQHLFSQEYEIGLFALKLIKKELFFALPDDEASYIALHLVNSETKNEKISDNNKIVENIADIVSNNLNIDLDKSSFSYSRFTTHIHYLISRCQKCEQLQTENEKMFKSMIESYPNTYACVKEIAYYLEDTLQIILTNEEKLYLIIHVNRLFQREENK